MDWRPSGYMFTTEQLIRALFDDSTDEAKLLIAATAGEVELFAKNKSWNAVLWLIIDILKEDGKPIYSGTELGDLRSSLPIVWR
tara:strand:- start:318 stop:569 length:252 start_codon:yes stop_codon:yes gene_type:complete